MTNSTTLKYIRPHLQSLKPYSTARDELGQVKGEIFLDANENSLGGVIGRAVVNGRNIITGEIHGADDSNFPDLSRYPDPHSTELCTSVSRLPGVKPDNVLLTNGSDEAIDLLFKAFCEPGKDSIIICPPTYGMYAVTADIYNVATHKVPLQSDFTFDTETVLAQAKRSGAKLLFVCSPNNPTGNLVPKNEILELQQQFDGIVVVDEAYIDFAPPGSSLAQDAANCNNMLVLQTFSKAWGLAGARLGKVIGNPLIIKLFSAIKAPYNVNCLSQQILEQALERTDELKRQINDLNRLREELVSSLKQVPCCETVYPSSANYLLVRFKDGNKVFNFLRSQGIIVRNRHNEPLCENCLRITVGSDFENKKLVAFLNNFNE
ncbi:MAG: histidinol-phosphate transaminase [bacterium]|nr:histidinol-phosphate transaminase [bacterium]